jgi:hypothetical protein
MVGPLRLHYCHGLESGPQGYKVQSMMAWATVVCPDQEMSLFNPLKANSIVRSLASSLFTTKPADWASQAFCSSLERCAQVQRDALAADTDVLVASSWGGAVALKLLADGSYSGPAVLMCPAYRAAESWAAAFGVERLREETTADGARDEPMAVSIATLRARTHSARRLAQWSESPRSTRGSSDGASSCTARRIRPFPSSTRGCSRRRRASG